MYHIPPSPGKTCNYTQTHNNTVTHKGACPDEWHHLAAVTQICVAALFIRSNHALHLNNSHRHKKGRDVGFTVTLTSSINFLLYDTTVV